MMIPEMVEDAATAWVTCAITPLESGNIALADTQVRMA